MKWHHKLVTTLVVAATLWLVSMSALSLLANGMFYHVEQPVPLKEIREGEVVLSFTRTAVIGLAGECATELQCTQLYQFGARPCPLEKGLNCFDMALPLPENAEGQCQYRGSVTYSPFGTFGPALTYLWESESFEIGGKPRKVSEP